jgi:tungstate transport system permease protein
VTRTLIPGLVRADPELRAIAGLSLGVSGAASALAALIGIPVGLSLHLKRFRGRRAVGVLVNRYGPAAGGRRPRGHATPLADWPIRRAAAALHPSRDGVRSATGGLPIVTGFTRAAVDLLDPDLVLALRADGAGDGRIGFELGRAAGPPLLVAVAAGFGRAISEVGASLMVGGNIVGRPEF